MASTRTRSSSRPFYTLFTSYLEHSTGETVSDGFSTWESRRGGAEPRRPVPTRYEAGGPGGGWVPGMYPSRVHPPGYIWSRHDAQRWGTVPATRRAPSSPPAIEAVARQTRTRTYGPRLRLSYVTRLGPDLDSSHNTSRKSTKGSTPIWPIGPYMIDEALAKSCPSIRSRSTVYRTG